jgi:hypothetical protein
LAAADAAAIGGLSQKSTCLLMGKAATVKKKKVKKRKEKDQNRTERSTKEAPESDLVSWLMMRWGFVRV